MLRRAHRAAPLFAGLALLGCSSSSTRSTMAMSGAAGSLSEADACGSGQPFAGTTYDVTKSRFAFGSTPTVDTTNPSMTRWVGADGVVGVSSNGNVLGIMNAGAPETALADWTSDDETLASHGIDYFVSLGVPRCQIGSTQINGSGGGGGAVGGTVTPSPSHRTIVLLRAIDGILVAESTAYALFDADDQTTSEGLYWPAISADVVAAARAFQAQLATSAGLAAYKQRLPSNAQGSGTIFVHHPSGSSVGGASFRAVATYDVTGDAGPLGMPATLHFDADGAAVMPGD